MLKSYHKAATEAKISSRV